MTLAVPGFYYFQGIYLLSHEAIVFLGKCLHSVAFHFELSAKLRDNLPGVNECAKILLVNNVTNSIRQIDKTQDFLNFSTILCAGL